jgi:hypothetical protein
VRSSGALVHGGDVAIDSMDQVMNPGSSRRRLQTFVDKRVRDGRATAERALVDQRGVPKLSP